MKQYNATITITGNIHVTASNEEAASFLAKTRALDIALTTLGGSMTSAQVVVNSVEPKGEPGVERQGSDV